jgi:hypothetical protein
MSACAVNQSMTKPMEDLIPKMEPKCSKLKEINLVVNEFNDAVEVFRVPTHWWQLYAVAYAGQYQLEGIGTG